MEKEKIIYIIIALIVGIFIGTTFLSQKGNTNIPELNDCRDELSTCQSVGTDIITPRRDHIEVLFDYMGATGDESSGFGNGWIDDEECLEQINKIDDKYKSCKIESIQILTGSDPNPLKVNMETSEVGWQIFDNVGIFKAKCYCSETDEF